MVADSGPRPCTVIFGLFRKTKHAGQHDEIRRTFSESRERKDTALRVGLDESEGASSDNPVTRADIACECGDSQQRPPTLLLYIMEDRMQI